MRITPAGPDDLAAILALEEVFPPGQRWKEASWADELAAHSRIVLAARDGSTVVGVVLVAVLHDFADLLRILVASGVQRRGVGDALLHEALELAARRVLLEVRDDNEPALGLYRKHGFHVIDRRRDYYGSGIDALVLERPAPKEETA